MRGHWTQLMRIELIALLAMPLVTACDTRPEVRLEDFRAAGVSPPVPKIDFTLTDQTGSPFSFRDETDGFATLLFFGYTYCPDICPIHMSQIAEALRQVEEDVADQIKVVFVSVDPDRDTPERLDQWLGAFDERFVGLTGSIDQINEIMLQMHFRPSRTAQGSEQNYGVSHSSSVVGYTPDNVGRFLYMAGTRIEDYVNDMPLLVHFRATE